MWQMVSDLGDLCHIRSVTTDSYQSEQFRQELIVGRVADIVEEQSTVKKPDPYLTASRLVQAKQVVTGPCPELTKQMEHVQLDISKTKDKVSGSGGYRYDVCDALVGATYACSSDYEKAVTYRIEETLFATPLAPAERVAMHLEGFQVM